MANKELKSITFEGLDDTYTLLTEEEVNTKLSEYAKTSEITQIDIQTVNALPEVGVKGVIYLVPSTLKMTPLLSNRLATVQANTNNSATFSVDKTTNIKAGMTLKFVNNGTMGEATVASVTASTKTVTLTTKATLAKGTLVFDNSKYGKDTCAEYIWNSSTNKFERLGIVDVNAVSTATPQSVVARDWNGRAQIENPSVAKDIANKDYVDNTINTKLSEYAKTSELDKKLDKGNFNITENNITSPVDGTITSQRNIIASKVYGTNNSGNVNDFLDLREYTSEGLVDVTTWGQEYTNEQLREMFQTAKVDFVPSPYKDWEFVSLTENTDNWVGKYRRTGNTSVIANLTYYLSNASSENANKFKSDYAYLTFSFSLTEVKPSERKIWDIVNPDLVVSASSTNSVSGKAVSNALAKKADKSELDSKLDSTAFGTFSFNNYEFGSDSTNASLYLGPYGGDDVDRLYLNKNRIGKTKLNIGAGRVDTVWKIGQENSETPTLTAGSKSETLENIIDAPSKITNKQDKLISGTNIKTINGESVLGSGNISITTPIDDTLSDTSTNAVQNKVVKAAIDGKVNKTTNKQVVYACSNAGVDTTLPYDDKSNTSTVAVRGEKGVLQVGTPTANNHATTKKYVDDGLVNNIYEANLKWGGKNFAANFGVLDAALISNLGADRFRGIELTDGIVIEYSRDGGTTWIDYELSSDSKKQIFSDVVPADPIVVGKATTTTEATANYKLRVTIDCNAVNVYTKIKKFAINVTTSGSTDCTCTIQSSNINDETNYDITHAENIPISGWSGWNIINIPGEYLFGSTNTASYYRKNIRFIFSIGGHHSSGTGLQLLNIKAFGGMGWVTPSREAKYGTPFQYGGTKYNADRLFNFIAGAQINNKEISTKEYVDSKAVTVIDNVTSTSTTAALSANQGKMLKLAIDGKLSSTIVNNDKETDILAGDISVTQINGSSGISGGIKIENAMPAFYSGSKSETIENVIDSVEKVEDLSVLKNDYDIISSSTWTYVGSNSGGNGEPNRNLYHYISYVCPINPQVIESAKIINPSTGATVATCTGQAELSANTHSTVYHFGSDYSIVIVRPQDGNIFGLQSGAVPSNPWRRSLYEGVFLTGPLADNGTDWYIEAINTGGLQSVKVDFGDTPLYVRKPLVKTQYTAASSQTLYKYITHTDTGIKECEIYACAENVTINSPWGSLYEGTLGSYSFKSGFFTSEPEIHLEMLNTVTTDESGGVACFIETGIKPTTTSTGTLYAVRPNSGATAKKIYFKIHAKQV